MPKVLTCQDSITNSIPPVKTIDTTIPFRLNYLSTAQVSSLLSRQKGWVMQAHHSSPFVSAPITMLLSSQFLPPRVNDSAGDSVFRNPSHEELGSKRYALVVDDVPDVSDMLSVLLTHAGYEVVTADCALAAIDAASQQHFDVIISDIGMPHMNGYELVRRLRALPGYETVPMVAVTGYSMFDDRERSLSAGFNAHMTKPIEPRSLLDLIEQL